MKNIRSIHKAAMELGKSAKEALAVHDFETFQRLTTEALNFEKEAAYELITEFQSEPTRSVLFRSAATMAHNIGLFDEAEKLTHLGLSGNPYSEIKAELNNLLEACTNAIKTQISVDAALENAYLDYLRGRAINLKIESKERRFSNAIASDYIIDFLKNVQRSFRNFTDVCFSKSWEINDLPQNRKILSSIKKETRLLCVDFAFGSFGVSIVTDPKVMGYHSEKLTAFKDTLFEDFKNDVLLAELNSKEFQNKIIEKYAPDEIEKIYSPIINIVSKKSEYTVSLTEPGFKRTIRELPRLTIEAEDSLLFQMLRIDQKESDPIKLRRTFSLVGGRKLNSKLLDEYLDYAEFKYTLDSGAFKEFDVVLMMPYEIKVVFEEGLFIVDDTRFKIYVESPDFKELQQLYKERIMETFIGLLQTDTNNLSTDEASMLEQMNHIFLKDWESR